MKELIALIKLNAEAGTLLENMSLFDEFDDMVCKNCMESAKIPNSDGVVIYLCDFRIDDNITFRVDGDGYCDNFKKDKK